MSVHQVGPSCTGCQAKLVTAHAYLQDWFANKIKPKFPQAHISWGWRDQGDQELFYSQGKTRAHWPDSPHNWTERGVPCSLALDLFSIDDTGAASWVKDFFEAVNQFNLDTSEPIVWGGTFKSIGDGDHFQVDPSKVKPPTPTADLTSDTVQA